MEIYQPSDDSYLFSDFLKSYLPPTPYHLPPTTYLDMGTGSGILAKTASEFLNKKNITAVDINPTAIKKLKNQPFKTIQSDLFKNLYSVSETPKPRNPKTPKTIKSNQKFDLIVFNAPYLPRDEREPKDSQVATTGGKRGDEISLRFLKQAKSHLTKNGKILLLISSLTPTEKIKKLWPYKIVARKKIFMEELLILEFN